MAAEEIIAASPAGGRESPLIELCERGWIPDRLTRLGIRHLLAARLHDEGARNPAVYEARKCLLVEQLRSSPIALSTLTANAQHYEVPTEFFLACLGPQLKYSSCLYPHNGTRLEQAETAMLALTCERAALADGMRILELGCGWGSLSLYLAEQYPRSKIVAVSNSRNQRDFIENRCHARDLKNLQVVTADMRDFAADGRFDRVLSVEMFEHMRNYETLLARIAGWLEPAGRLFVHIFCHRNLAYPFYNAGADDWMSRRFFTDGLMPSFDLLLHFQRDLRLQERWWLNGTHYARTCEDWLRNCDIARDRLLELFSRDAGVEPARALQRWRMFFLACAELFAFRDGNEWGVGHYLFARP